jgi:vacuolar-type H+-ATPase subunit D/Vma8
MLIRNKQTLLLLKKQIKMVQKSRKLLDEKLNGLIRSFRQSLVEGYQLEETVKKESGSIIANFLEASSFISPESLQEFIKSLDLGTLETAYQLQAGTQKFFGVKIPRVKLDLRQLKMDSNVKPKLATSLQQFNQKIPFFLELSQARIKCQLLADEIAKTNRLIANLDRTMTKIQQDIKMIQTTLLEKENATKAVLIKLFN